MPCYAMAMTSSIDPVELAKALIACPSITPARGEVFDVLEAALREIVVDAGRAAFLADHAVEHARRHHPLVQRLAADTERSFE